MVIKNFFVFFLLMGMTKATWARPVILTNEFAKGPLVGLWEFLEITEEPSPNPLGKYPYPESIVIKPTIDRPHIGQIEIKLLAKNDPVVYEFSENLYIRRSEWTTYDKVPDHDPYQLFTDSVVRLEEESILFIKLRWEKWYKDGKVEWISSGSYTFMVEGDTLFFTRTNIDDPSKSNIQTVYKATYTRHID